MAAIRREQDDAEVKECSFRPQVGRIAPKGCISGTAAPACGAACGQPHPSTASRLLGASLASCTSDPLRCPQINAKSARMVEGRQQILRVRAPGQLLDLQLE